MKKVFSLLFFLSACVGMARGQSYPEPDKRKSYSVLSSAQTLKIAVAQDAVYKVGYEDLASHGLLSQSVPSDRIGLYGNVAGMLPFFNTAGIYDDLSPLPIQMYDGNDGIFGPGDYFIFYGQSPHRWNYAPATNAFTMQRHYFSDSTFYFVSLNAELEHRTNTSSVDENATVSIDWFPEHIHHENDLENLCNGGLYWLGESFVFSGSSHRINLATPNAVNERKGLLSIGTGAVTHEGTASFRVQTNRKTISLFHNRIGEGQGVSLVSAQDSVSINSAITPVDISFTKTGSTGNAYLDYLSLVYPRYLQCDGTPLFFRHPSAINNNVRFSIETSAGTQVWDITDVYHIASIQTQRNGTRIEFNTIADNKLHEYVAFSTSDCPSPDFKGIVPVQNLHQLKNIEYIVVTHPLFLEQAQNVAELHRQRDGYSVCVATTEQIYNEFSSGAKDPSAIRMFLRHLNIRSDSVQPHYLLLFGAASYDYKGVLGTLSDFVPSFQTFGLASEGGNDPLEDLFGYIADEAGMSPESLSTKGNLQIAVGRLPIRSVAEARNMVEKIDIYSSPSYVHDASQPNLSGNFGDWRNEIVFVTDDGFEPYMEEKIINNDYIQRNRPYIHVNKLYSDNYERASSSTTAKIPALENDIKNFVENGCLFLGYEGHSGWDAWSDEKILTNALIENWKTSYTFPVIFASSCTFAFFDQINKISGAERAVLRPHGGAIASIASSRTASTGSIEDIQKRFVETFTDKSKGKINTIGEAFLYAKTTATHAHRQKFVLLGDPGLKAALPKGSVETLHINGKPANYTDIDTLKALSPITIEGRILGTDGQALNHFNGWLNVKVYDKMVTKTTLGLYNSREGHYNMSISYNDQNSLLFQGQTEVKDGWFNFSFIVPKDIQYNYGMGRICYYAYNDDFDANGGFENIVVGGMNPEAVIDTLAPIVNLYIGKNTFTGGTVGDEPTLYAEISDEYGINTTGAGIGHDMTLIIDNNYKNALSVNNYFRYKTGSYKEGSLLYPLNLDPGQHTAKLKVWNINNVSTTKEIHFTVNASNKLQIFNLKAIPNPARGEYVDFYFNHNSKNGGIEKCTLSIFNLQGMRIAEFNYTMSDLSGYTVGPLRWNLCGNGNKRVQAGMYVGYIKATDARGVTVHKDIKLIVVN